MRFLVCLCLVLGRVSVTNFGTPLGSIHFANATPTMKCEHTFIPARSNSREPAPAFIDLAK
jgi:hypothetical protein